MDVGFTRPKVADLLFRLYDAPIHPELFEAFAVREVKLHDATLTVRLTPTGHALTWQQPGAYLLEATTTRHALPDRGLMTHPFQGTRRGRLRLGNVKYEVSLHAEVLPPDLFAHAHDELAADGARRGVVGYAPPRTRFGLTPLGVVLVQALPSGFAVQTFHTFPDEFALVKTQSLIEVTDEV